MVLPFLTKFSKFVSICMLALCVRVCVSTTLPAESWAYHLEVMLWQYISVKVEGQE